MIVAIHFPFTRRFFKGWAKRPSFQEQGRVLTTPDMDKAKDMTLPMADCMAARINDQGGDALVLAVPSHVHTGRCSPDWCRA